MNLPPLCSGSRSTMPMLQKSPSSWERFGPASPVARLRPERRNSATTPRWQLRQKYEVNSVGKTLLHLGLRPLRSIFLIWSMTMATSIGPHPKSTTRGSHQRCRMATMGEVSMPTMPTAPPTNGISDSNVPRVLKIWPTVIHRLPQATTSDSPIRTTDTIQNRITVAIGKYALRI